MHQRQHYARRLCAAVAAAITMASFASLSATSAAERSPKRTTAAPVPISSLKDLEALLRAGASTKDLAGVVVPVTQVDHDVAAYRGCLIAYNANDGLAGRPSNTTCTWGDAAAAKTVVLYGDSAAASWVPAFNALGLANGFKVVLVARQSCRTASIETLDYWTDASGAACRAFRTQAVPMINALKPAAVVIVDHASSIQRADNHTVIPEATYAAAEVATYQALSAPRRELIQFSDLPDFAVSPTACLKQHPHAVKTCNSPLSVATQHAFGYSAALAAQGGAHFVNVERMLCTSSTCPIVVNHTITTYDGGGSTTNYKFGGNFLTAHFSAELAPVLGQVLAPFGI